jgi:hypothetical protein
VLPAKPKKPSVYHRVLQVIEAFHTIGSPLDGRSIGAGYRVTVMSARPSGSIHATFQVQNDGRYAVDFRLEVIPPTDEERSEISYTCVSATNIRAFEALFDLMAIRSRVPTFEPDEVGQVQMAFDSIFGCRDMT